MVSGVQESLGRNATYIKASSSKGASLLNANSLEALLGSLDGSDVAAGTTTDDSNVILGREAHLGKLELKSGASKRF